MQNLITLVNNFLREDRAVTAIEYALIASLIAVFIIAAVSSVGQSLLGLFQSIAADFP
ncbi:Flp family type IVb pilin [Cupriavidus sp.]|uniref:Flp family type IVb pilin n=1 Tax=Cupriavidus sp. TaxID=1873897 RepID=UPI00044A6B2A